MNKNILIITSSIDCTVDYFIEKNVNIASFFRINVDELNSYSISIGDSNLWSITNINTKKTIEKKDIHSIYYRKPMFPNLSEYETYYHNMIQKDILALLHGLVDAFEGKVLTKPSLLKIAENKVNQLIYSRENHLNIPKSFIGNRNEDQKNFSLVKSIIKPLTTGKIYTDDSCEIYQTNYFEYKNDDISLTPIYLQEYIEKQYEVRLTVINNHFYAVRIDTLDKLDWRKDYDNHKYSLIECPEKIKDECLKILNHYNLVFGAFDYIVTPENKWFFLELNPNGQWLWLEEALNLKISNNIFDYLEE